MPLKIISFLTNIGIVQGYESPGYIPYAPNKHHILNINQDNMNDRNSTVTKVQFSSIRIKYHKFVGYKAIEVVAVAVAAVNVWPRATK